jgi:hypothetical protein
MRQKCPNWSQHYLKWSTQPPRVTLIIWSRVSSWFPDHSLDWVWSPQGLFYYVLVNGLLRRRRGGIAHGLRGLPPPSWVPSVVLPKGMWRFAAGAAECWRTRWSPLDDLGMRTFGLFYYDIVNDIMSPNQE